ncbi:MAG: hypothetical protein JXA66_00105 [Oligoflexia bacterium]|nr:hypothetical protein [Oligoflexia bacterium]
MPIFGQDDEMSLAEGKQSGTRESLLTPADKAFIDYINSADAAIRNQAFEQWRDVLTMAGVDYKLVDKCLFPYKKDGDTYTFVEQTEKDCKEEFKTEEDVLPYFQDQVIVGFVNERQKAEAEAAQAEAKAKDAADAATAEVAAQSAADVDVVQVRPLSEEEELFIDAYYSKKDKLAKGAKEVWNTALKNNGLSGCDFPYDEYKNVRVQKAQKCIVIDTEDMVHNLFADQAITDFVDKNKKKISRRKRFRLSMEYLWYDGLIIDEDHDFELKGISILKHFKTSVGFEVRGQSKKSSFSKEGTDFDLSLKLASSMWTPSELEGPEREISFIPFDVVLRVNTNNHKGAVPENISAEAVAIKWIRDTLNITLGAAGGFVIDNLKMGQSAGLKLVRLSLERPIDITEDNGNFEVGFRINVPFMLGGYTKSQVVDRFSRAIDEQRKEDGEKELRMTMPYSLMVPLVGANGEIEFLIAKRFIVKSGIGVLWQSAQPIISKKEATRYELASASQVNNYWDLALLMRMPFVKFMNMKIYLKYTLPNNRLKIIPEAGYDFFNKPDRDDYADDDAYKSSQEYRDYQELMKHANEHTRLHIFSFGVTGGW